MPPMGSVPTVKASAGLSLPSPLREHLDGVLQVHPVDVGADLPQGDREQIQLLIADGLVGGHQHPPPLVELHQILLGFHLGLGMAAPSSTQRRALWSSSGTEAMER